MPKTILITGGTGLIGTRLTQLLIEKGHTVKYLSRSPDQSGEVPQFKWDINKQEIDPKAFDGVDSIIHLAGAGVADQRWTKERKRVILESRTKSIQLLNSYLKNTKNQVTSFLSASGINYYGYDGGGVWKKEGSRFGDDFLATVVKAWEGEADQLGADHPNIRVAKFRTGLVLSAKGGALEKIARPIKLFVGAPLGSGDQYMSWIHINDLCQMYVHALENDEVQGVYNAVGPDPVTNKIFTKTAAKVLKKPLWLPNVPGFALRLVLGEMASLVLGGLRVSNEKIVESGYRYQFNSLKSALNDLLRNS